MRGDIVNIVIKHILETVGQCVLITKYDTI
jgi:hypothetical protein